MKKLSILIPIIIFGILFAQTYNVDIPFATGNDTIFDTTANSSDTIDCQLGTSELPMGEWQALSKVIADNDTVYITGDDKTAQRTKIYYLASETWWTWAEVIRFRIRAEDDTLTSKYMSMSNKDGAATLFVQPTLYGDATKDTIIYKVRFGIK